MKNQSRDTRTTGKTSKLTFWGAAGVVTGSNFVLDIPEVGKLMIDCGLFQIGPASYEKNRQKFPYNPAEIDVLLVTHAHIDHIGRIPKLVREGFRGPIFSTSQTKEIAAIMFEDALKLMEQESHKHGDTGTLYTKADISQTLSQWQTKKYHEKFAPLEKNKEISCEFLDAGHILGSAMVKVSRVGQGLASAGAGIVFSGDLGNSPSPIVRGADSAAGVQYLVVDGTYGNRTHEPRVDAEKKFAAIVKKIIQEKRTLLIPAFSLERAHIILFELNNLVESGEVPSVPVYLDSPLASRLTSIYQSSSDILNVSVNERLSKKDDIFEFPKLKVVASSNESAQIDKEPNPKIIIAGSGMSVGGRIPAHEIALLPDPNTTLLITGYQSHGTLGRSIADGAKRVTINNQDVTVRANIEFIEGFSAHRDGAGLLEFVENAKDSLKKVFVVHSEPGAGLFLVQRIRDYVGLDALYGEEGKIYEINL